MVPRAGIVFLSVLARALAFGGLEVWNDTIGTGHSYEVVAVGMPPYTSLFVGSIDGFVYSYEATTGSRQWSTQVGGQVVGAPAVTTDAVFVGTYAGRVKRLNGQTGLQEWVFPAQESSPIGVLHGRTVYDTDHMALYVCSWDGYLYALHASDGHELWRFSPSGVHGQSSSRLYSAPALSSDGQTVYASVADGSVFALETAGGSEIWRTNLTSRVNQTSEVIVSAAVLSRDGSAQSSWASKAGGCGTLQDAFPEPSLLTAAA